MYNPFLYISNTCKTVAYKSRDSNKIKGQVLSLKYIMLCKSVYANYLIDKATYNVLTIFFALESTQASQNLLKTDLNVVFGANLTQFFANLPPAPISPQAVMTCPVSV